MTATAPAAVEEITGNISTLYCQRDTFSAGKITVRGREVKFSIRGHVRAGEPYTLRGSFITDPKWGREFKATGIVYTLPVNVEGLSAWLKWYGVGIGPVKARKLVDEFGLDLGRILTEDPAQIAIAAGIELRDVEALAVKWSDYANHVAAASQFAAWGLTQHETESILTRYQGGAVATVAHDPYTLLGRIDGFGWAKVDGLAAKIGVVGDDPRRLRGAVQSVVSERYGEGSTATPVSVACDLAADKLGGNFELAEKVAATVDEAVEAGRLMRGVAATGEAWLATRAAWDHEAVLWRAMATSRNMNPCVAAGAIDEEDTPEFAIEFCRKYYGRVSEGVTLDDGQLTAVVRAVRYRISVITGGAGAGKTLVARQITKFFTDGDVHVTLCAPTGKAARRLTEVIGRPASTIHRLLGWAPHLGRFMYDAVSPLPAGVVIVDEASMIDSALGASLLAACGPKTAVVLIGDPNQLPPVGAGAMLRDVLAHDLAPVTRLEHCHRQAGTLKQNCNAILTGVVEPHASDEEPSPWVVSRKVNDAEMLANVVKALYAKHLPEWGFDPVTDAQFMTAKHAGRYGTIAVNLMLQRLHQATLGNVLPEPPAVTDESEERAEKKTRPVLYVGDKVIQTKNDYTLGIAGIMNGTIGIVTITDPLLSVRYDDEDVNYTKDQAGQVSLAYCLSVHKMQGSEVPCAIVIVPKAHAFMQHRHWLYTAVTRAKKVAVIIGDDDGIRRAAEKVENDKRVTLLDVWARHEEARP